MRTIGNAITTYVMPLLVVVLLVVVLFDRRHRDAPTPDSVVVTHDAKAVQLGREYKQKAATILATQLHAVQDAKITDLDVLTMTQRDALDKALEAAYIPIAAEMETRFGKAEDPDNKVSVALVKNFFADLEYGYNGGK